MVLFLKPVSETFGRAIPFFGYAALACLFGSALIGSNQEILSFGFPIFVMEFISIHSVPFTSQIIKLKKGLSEALSLLGLYAFYSVFVVAFSASAGNLAVVPYFWFSSALKVAAWKQDENANPFNASYFISFAAFILLTVGIAFISMPFCAFRGGNSLYSFSNGSASGLFVDCPAALALWGILYFGLMAVVSLLPSGFLGKALPNQNIRIKIR